MPWTPPENPQSVKAKFYVTNVDLNGYSTTIKMRVVTRGEENKQWSAATPVGEISMSVKNEYAAAQFYPGQEWFVTFDHDAEQTTP